MKKILIVYTRFNYGEVTYGGLSKMLLWLGNNVATNGHDVTFCTVYDKTPTSRILCPAKSITLGVKYYTNFLMRNSTIFIQVMYLLAREMRKGRYDYVISFGDITFHNCLFLRKFFKYKFIVSERADPNFDHSSFGRLKRKNYKFVDTLVCQTEGAKKFFSRDIQKISCVIPNPIDIPNIKWDRRNTKKEIACVGRIHFWQKRQDVLVDAFEQFHKVHSDYRLNIYGGGEDINRLKDLIIENCLNEFIVVHGSVNNVREKLLENEVFVLTSAFEGIPNALLEAMSLGMPVVSTKCSPGGAEFLITHGVNGLLAECNNPDDISSKLCQIIENPQEADAMAASARISLERFSSSNIIKLWKKIFK